MRFREVFVSASSACFEWENDAAYYAPEAYCVLLNGAAVGEKRKENVFSLFSLQPDTAYTVQTTLSDFTLTFRTKYESACLPVRDFGAVGDGITDDTLALQTAISACPKDGRVLLLEGVYRTGPLLLKSDMTLELAAGATLLGSADPNDYPVWPALAGSDADGKGVICAAWEGRPHASCQSLLSAHHAANIRIVGEGTLNGNAAATGWWINPKQRKTGRPRMLFVNDCERVVLHGVHVSNSPAWNLHPYRSRQIGIFDVFVSAPPDSPNTDGCDPESCDGVEIIGTRFSVGDDAIAIKSGKAVPGELCFPCARNHVIRNCLMEYAHGAVVLGSEASGGIEALSVSQCLFIDTDRGLRIKTRRGRGKFSVIDGVAFERIVMRGVKTPLVINMFYFCDPDGKSEYVQSRSAQPVDDGTPYLGRFRFSDITCEDCHAAAGFFCGLPERPIGGVTIENARFSFAENATPFAPAMLCGVEPCTKAGLLFLNAERIALKNVQLEGISGERVTLDGVGSFTEE